MGRFSAFADDGSFNSTERTRPSSPGKVLMIRAIGHCCLLTFGSFNKTTSSTAKFLLGLFHLFRIWRLCKYSFLNLVQNSFARCWTCLQRFRQYISALWKFPGGGKTTLLFNVSNWIGDKAGEDGSLVSVVRGLELTISSASVSKVWSASSVNYEECSCKREVRTARTERIWRSQTPPLWLASGTFLFHLIQSHFSSKRESCILSWSMSL